MCETLSARCAFRQNGLILYRDREQIFPATKVVFIFLDWSIKKEDKENNKKRDAARR
jgi:hypothetical protein